MATASIGKVYPTDRIREAQLAILMANRMLSVTPVKNNNYYLTWKRY